MHQTTAETEEDSTRSALSQQVKKRLTHRFDDEKKNESDALQAQLAAANKRPGAAQKKKNDFASLKTT